MGCCMPLISRKTSFVLIALMLAAPAFAADEDAADTGASKTPPAADAHESKITATFPGSPLDAKTTNEGDKQRTPGDTFGLSQKQQEDLLQGIEQKIRSLNTLSSPGMDNPVVRARFEKFLNTPSADPKDVNRYVATIHKIQELIRNRDDHAACKLLYDLSAFEWDAEIGESLANRVEVTWDMRLTQAQLEEKMAGLRKEVHQEIWNTEMLMKDDSTVGKPQDASSAQGKGGSSSSSSSSSSNSSAAATTPTVSPGDFSVDTLLNGGVTVPARKLRATEEYLQRLEAGARLKTSELKSDAIELKDRSDFEDYVNSLFASQRHLYTIIAADFYRELFGDGDYPPSMADKVNASKEVIRDVDQSVEVIKFKMDNNELAGAYEHLQYAFLASEFHPALLTLSRDAKRKIRAFGFNVLRLQNMLEARDFGEIEPLLKEMQTQASDFDPTKVRAIVDAVKLESRLRLGAAKLAAQGGDLKTAMAEFRAAAQTWPANPDLDLAQLGFFNSQDVKTQMQVEFDRLISAKNYRGIFEKQLQLAPALAGDSARIDQMKAALEKVKGAETAIEKANLFRRNNNPYAAWETLESAAQDWADDSELNKMRAELAGESAEFVQQIKKGEEAEHAGHLGSSLAFYLNAQRLYPMSDVARTAIERLSGRLLNKSS